MTYYEKRREVLEWIDDTIDKQECIDKKNLLYTLSKRWGFGHKILDDHLGLLESMDRISIDGDVVSKNGGW